MAVISTVQEFGVPLGGGGGRGGLLQPKQKNKFRVTVYSFGPINGGLALTQQVVTCGRPKLGFAEVEIHAFNSTDWFAGKAKWETLELVVRDDITNTVSSLVGYQEQKQMNFFQQTTTTAGTNYKFQMTIELLDGGNTTVFETWYLEGCWLTSITYSDLDYSTGDAATISMTVRYANATLEGGIMPLNPQLSNSGINVS